MVSATLEKKTIAFFGQTCDSRAPRLDADRSAKIKQLFFNSIMGSSTLAVADFTPSRKEKSNEEIRSSIYSFNVNNKSVSLVLGIRVIKDKHTPKIFYNLETPFANLNKALQETFSPFNTALTIVESSFGKFSKLLHAAFLNNWVQRKGLNPRSLPSTVETSTLTANVLLTHISNIEAAIEDETLMSRPKSKEEISSEIGAVLDWFVEKQHLTPRQAGVMKSDRGIRQFFVDNDYAAIRPYSCTDDSSSKEFDAKLEELRGAMKLERANGNGNSSARICDEIDEMASKGIIPDPLARRLKSSRLELDDFLRKDSLYDVTDAHKLVLSAVFSAGNQYRTIVGFPPSTLLVGELGRLALNQAHEAPVRNLISSEMETICRLADETLVLGHLPLFYVPKEAPDAGIMPSFIPCLDIQLTTNCADKIILSKTLRVKFMSDLSGWIESL